MTRIKTERPFFPKHVSDEKEKLRCREVTPEMLMAATDAKERLGEPVLPRRDRLSSLMQMIEDGTFSNVV